MFKYLFSGLVVIGTFLFLFAHAALAGVETWTVDGKTFTAKSQAVRYLIANGKSSEVVHSRCEILTNKLSFKACPKNGSSFENMPFNGKLSVSGN